MHSRDRIRCILDGEEPDRVGFQDADFFSDTLERWHGEGLPRGVDVPRPNLPWLNVPGLRYFGHDIYVTWPDISLKYELRLGQGESSTDRVFFARFDSDA